MSTPEERFGRLVSGAGSAPLSEAAINMMAQAAGIPEEPDPTRELRGIIERALRGRTATSGARHSAKRVHDAGYRKRITITTLDGINALPTCTVLKVPGSYMPLNRSIEGWMSIDYDGYTPDESWLPATVLYDPSEEN